MLAGFRITLGFLRALDCLVQNCHQLTPTPERIHCTAFDQRLQHALVKQS